MNVYTTLYLTPIHTYICICIHTHKSTVLYSYAHMYICTHAHIPTNLHKQHTLYWTLMHVYIYIHTHIHTHIYIIKTHCTGLLYIKSCICTNQNMRSEYQRACLYTHIYTYIYIYTYTHIFSYTHTSMNTLIHTYIHTYTYVRIWTIHFRLHTHTHIYIHFNIINVSVQIIWTQRKWFVDCLKRYVCMNVCINA